MKYMKKIVLTTAALLVLPAINSMASNYALMPGVNYVNMGKNHSATVTYSVLNKDSSDLILAVSPVYQAAGSSNAGPFQNDKALADQAQFSLLPYLRFSPEKLVIKAGDTRTVRISVRMPGNLPAGTYRVGIDFAQQQTPSEVASQQKLKPDQLSAQITPLIDQIGALYVNVGTGNAQSAQISCHTVAAGDVQINVNNNTNWIFNPSVDVYPASSSISSSKPSTTVIPVPVMAQTAGMREVKWTAKDQGPYKIVWTLRETKNAVPTTVICD
ncbi:MAG: hypothetical protein K0R66_88 [Gammaproteobacteria bacterium]|jgi:hypothetical protein|nr:hypothetical protein [Gammaproteobacteria bacterium]